MKAIIDSLKGDKIIWTMVLFLSIISLLAVYSATGTIAQVRSDSYTFSFVLKHTSILLLGWVIMYVFHLIDYRYYSRIAQILFLISIPLLIYTMFAGTNINGASRWVKIPVINLTFQSSDLAKLGIVMYLARLMSKKQDAIKSFKDAFIPLILPVVVITLLIAPMNLSTALILFTTCMLLLFIGRVSFLHLGTLFLTAAISLAIFIGILFIMPEDKMVGRMHTWKNRIENYASNDKQEEDYQVKQANIAIAKGWPLGQGPGNSIQRNYLPEPYSDFIYAIIIEEYGIAGGIVIIIIYLIFFYRCISIVVKSPKAFGAFLAVGLGLSLTLQAMINMGVAVHLLPVTGVTLPFISMGGSSIWFNSMALGIILSVSRYIEEIKNEEVDEAFIPNVIETN
ncbi:MAG: FtsW/RodA/SpoVE family cell cycle protein [Bacteroidota bacterium]